MSANGSRPGPIAWLGCGRSLGSGPAAQFLAGLQVIQRALGAAEDRLGYLGVMRGGVDAAMSEQHLDDADIGQCCSLSDVSVGQTIVLCRLPTVPEGGRPQSAMVCPTKVNSIGISVPFSSR